jgi:sporulation protein YlmC with PRC-barrel domain
MINSSKELLGTKMYAAGEEIGKLVDIYFDENDWNIRYLVVEVGDWLDRNTLLFSPLAVTLHEEGLNIGIKKELIEKSPPIDLERPFSRQQEIELHRYYDWPFYWVRLDHSSYPLVEMYTEMKEAGSIEEDTEDHNLRSAKEVAGYKIAARDGDIGRVDNFLMDDDKWNIIYMVVDTGSWLPGRKVLISPSWVTDIDWSESRVRLDLEQNTIQNSPEYDPSEPLDRQYEERLYEYYERDKYWE